MFIRKTLTTGFITLGFTALASTASAMDPDVLNIVDQPVQTEITLGNTPLQNSSPLQSSPRDFDRFQMKYMRETYQDVKITLLGPITFGVSEDIIEHRFSNVDVNYGPRVQSPDYGGQFDTATYLRATAAKTSVKFKF